MRDFSSLTLWLILTMLIPGFFTIGILAIEFSISKIDFIPEIFENEPKWFYWSIFFISIIVTQMCGFGLEKLFVYFKKKKSLKNNLERVNVKQLYETLIMLDYHKVNDKHFERICGQFFMSCNTLASLFIGIVIPLFFTKQYNIRIFIILESILVFLAIVNLFLLHYRYMNLRDASQKINELIQEEKKRDFI